MPGQPPRDVPGQFARERELVQRVAADGVPVLDVWRPRAAIVLTARERAWMESRAAEGFRGRGYAVCVRDTGGGPVALGPGCLCVSWIGPGLRNSSIARSYEEFCEPLLAALRSLGIDAATGTLPGSYCDGTYNLLVRGRKLCGTSQRLYHSREDSVVRLCHATFTVSPPSLDYLDDLNEFVAAAADAAGYEKALTTCVTEWLATDDHAQAWALLEKTITAEFADVLARDAARRVEN